MVGSVDNRHLRSLEKVQHTWPNVSSVENKLARSDTDKRSVRQKPLLVEVKRASPKEHLKIVLYDQLSLCEPMRHGRFARKV